MTWGDQGTRCRQAASMRNIGWSRAEEARRQAAIMTDPFTRRTTLLIAAANELLAHHAEEQTRRLARNWVRWPRS